MTKDEATARSAMKLALDALEMVDDEGENRAVRMFLALYGGQYGVTAEQMRKHLSMSGFDGAWPEWANTHNGHLTKAGAQLWIRHLFSLEQPTPVRYQRIERGEGDWMDCTKEQYEKAMALPEWDTRVIAAPQPAQHKPLTDMQVDGEWILVRDLDTNDVEKSRLFARAIEAAHGIYAPAELKE